MMFGFGEEVKETETGGDGREEDGEGKEEQGEEAIDGERKVLVEIKADTDGDDKGISSVVRLAFYLAWYLKDETRCMKADWIAEIWVKNCERETRIHTSRGI